MSYRFNQGDRPLAGYTIQRGVGRGGFGEVYYSTSDGGKDVALKFLRENPQIELRGVMHCLNLKSPYLVGIHDIKQSADGEFFVIMEYVNGPSLRDLMNNEPGGLGVQKAAYFLREVGKGLAYLHDRGIVHRDLKPGNIFYEDGYVKIGDYGLAKIMAASQHSGQTMSVGTVHYMAPEVGSGNYDRTIDIYALGVMLYEMLLGKVPFSGSSMGEVLMKHLTAQPAVDELPAPFPNVIRKALAKDPNDRYQTVAEMVNDLFETADIEQSVASFEPASLSAAAARVAANLNVASPHGGVAVLGTGSSNVGQGIGPPVVNPAFGLGGFDRINNRVQGGLNRFADRIDQSALGRRIMVGGGDHSKIFAEVVVGGVSKRAETIARVATIAALSSLAIGFVSEPGQGLQAAAGAFAFMSAIVGGVVVGAYLSLEKLKSTNDYTARFIIAALTTFWSSLSLTVGRIGHGSHIERWFIAVAIIMLMSDWLMRFHDGRRGVVSGGKAFKVGLFAFIVAGFFDCNVPLMGFSVLAASLLVQMIGGAWPYPSLNGGLSPPPPPSAAQTIAPGSHGVEVSRDGVPAERRSNDSTRENGTLASIASTASQPRSTGARVAWFIASIPMLVGSVACFIASGLLAHDDRAIGMFCMGGVSSGVYGLFALTRSIGTVQRGLWRGVWRPLIFCIGIATGASCGIGAGLISSSDSQMFIWLIGTVSGAALSMLVWAIPVPVYAPPQTPEAVKARQKRRGQLLMGIGIAVLIHLLAAIPILIGTVPHHLQGTVMPAYTIPTFAIALMLIVLGGRSVALARGEKPVQATLPLRRTFEIDGLDAFERTCERHLGVLGYRLKEKKDLLWQYARGTWHAQFWQKDIRQWPVRLSLAAYESGTGRYRITCYLDIDRPYAEAKRKQIEQLDAELADLQDVLLGRDAPSGV
ncbi:MAG: serine/threonine-protein kinase [Planctomycetota bacterium]